MAQRCDNSGDARSASKRTQARSEGREFAVDLLKWCRQLVLKSDDEFDDIVSQPSLVPPLS